MFSNSDAWDLTFAELFIRVRLLQELQNEEEQADGGVHAAKLLEVFVLNFRGQLDSFIPEVIEPAIACLTRKSTILELRTRCLLVRLKLNHIFWISFVHACHSSLARLS